MKKNHGKWLIFGIVTAVLCLSFVFFFPKIKSLWSLPKPKSAVTIQKGKDKQTNNEKAEGKDDTKGPRNAYKYSKLQESLRELKKDVEEVKPDDKEKQTEIGTAGDSNAEQEPETTP